MISDKVKIVFDKCIDVIFSIFILIFAFGIAIGTIQLLISVWALIEFKGIHGQYIDIIADVLTLFVLIELSRSLVEYFNSHRLRLTFIVDAAIIFILRELLILIFKEKIDPQMIYAFSALILVLGALRIGSILMYQREKLLIEEG
jgi:uncharacterized membrane protein (DUF373 family)